MRGLQNPILILKDTRCATAIPEDYGNSRMGSLAALSFSEGAGKAQRQRWDLGWLSRTAVSPRITELQPHGSYLGQVVLGLAHWVLGQSQLVLGQITAVDWFYLWLNYTLVGFWVSQLIWGNWLLGCSLGQSVGFWVGHLGFGLIFVSVSGFGLIFGSMDWDLGVSLDQRADF